MRQDINLYRDGFVEPKIRFSANQMGVVAGIALLTFVGLSVLNAVNGERLKSRLLSLKGEEQRKSTEMKDLLVKLDAHKADPVLERQADRLQRSVHARQRLIGLLKESSKGNVQGFSPFLSGIAKHPVQGIWLTSIKLANGGSEIALSGVTTTPENIPGFLQSIGSETAFQGRQFEKLELKSEPDPDSNKERLKFQIRTGEQGGRR